MILFKNRQVIGTTEAIEIIDTQMSNVPAKIDTGAYYCSIWASDIKEDGKKLEFVLFDKTSPLYNGKLLTANKFYRLKIRNSFGHEERRYKVMLKIKIGQNTYNTFFTLANRSINKYPVLLGRNLLHNRFVVDVTKNNIDLRDAKGKLGKGK